MTIEKVQISDADKLLKIYSYYIKETAISFEYDIPSIDEFISRITDISINYPYIKAVDNDGTIVGYAYANTFKDRKAYDWSVETTIYVDKDRRGIGIGKKLYECLENSLQNMGILNLNACIAYTCESDNYLNNDSMYFHKKMGYSLVGTFHNSGYKFNKWYDMIWMEKMIGNHIENQPEVNFGNWSI